MGAGMLPENSVLRTNNLDLLFIAFITNKGIIIFVSMNFLGFFYILFCRVFGSTMTTWTS